jgi:hypothetical protein
MPLSPQEAVSRISEQVTVEMLVKAVKELPALVARWMRGAFG